MFWLGVKLGDSWEYAWAGRSTGSEAANAHGSMRTPASRCAELNDQRGVARAQLPPRNWRRKAIMIDGARPGRRSIGRNAENRRRGKIGRQQFARLRFAVGHIHREDQRRAAANAPIFMITVMNGRLKGRRQRQPMLGERPSPARQLPRFFPGAMRERSDNQSGKRDVDHSAFATWNVHGGQNP